MRIHCLQSAESEGPGVIADWAAGHGFPVSTSHLYRGDALPDPAAVDLLLLMGGPMNIYQDRDFPWLKPARAFIGGHVAARKPAIGICLGSQFLADALGGRVTQNPEIEIGWFPVTFLPEARARIAALPERLDVLHWHGDTFSLPEGALALAGSAACANQGFLHDGRVLALQFHPEMTRPIVSDLVAQEALPDGKFVQPGEEILGRPDESFAATHAFLKTLLDAIFVSR